MTINKDSKWQVLRYSQTGDEDEARLYGESYSALLDSVEEKIITLLEGLDCNLIKHTFQ